MKHFYCVSEVREHDGQLRGVSMITAKSIYKPKSKKRLWIGGIRKTSWFSNYSKAMAYQNTLTEGGTVV